MKNKQHQLKPALILCGVLFTVILIAYIASGNVNKNVVENMKGQMLYSVEDTLCRYDFEAKEESVIFENTEFDKALFYGETSYAYLSDGSIYLYDEEATLFQSQNVTDFDSDYSNTNMVYLTENDGRYTIYRYDGKDDSTEEVYSSDNVIYGVEFSNDHENIFYTEQSGDDTILYCLNKKNKSQEWIRAEDKVLHNIAIRDTIVLLTQSEDGEKDSIIRYVKGATRASQLDINSEDYNCSKLVPVYDEEYLVTSDKSGINRIYVCNGSNMVDVTGAGAGSAVVLMDYQNSGE